MLIHRQFLLRLNMSRVGPPLSQVRICSVMAVRCSKISSESRNFQGEFQASKVKDLINEEKNNICFNNFLRYTSYTFSIISNSKKSYLIWFYISMLKKKKK